MACILSFIMWIQLNILNDIDKYVFLIITEVGSDITSHFSAITK